MLELQCRPPRKLSTLGGKYDRLGEGGGARYALRCVIGNGYEYMKMSDKEWEKKAESSRRWRIRQLRVMVKRCPTGNLPFISAGVNMRLHKCLPAPPKQPLPTSLPFHAAPQPELRLRSFATRYFGTVFKLTMLMY